MLRLFIGVSHGAHQIVVTPAFQSGQAARPPIRRRRWGRGLVLALGTGLFAGPLGAAEPAAALPTPVPALPPAATVRVEFNRDIRPILDQRCANCHGAEKQKGGFRLDRKAAALKGGDNHAPAIRPGESAASPLIQFVAGQVPDMLMPPRGEPLTPSQIGLLRAWIDQGATWPDEPVAAPPPITHWSFQPVTAPPLPEPRNRRWARTPIDRFILDQLERAGLQPSPEADRRTLIRRLTLDLHGLPPTPDEVAAFEADPAPDAYERLVDRLLASPHYGERWARHWLDVVRFAETHGFEMNQPRPNAWPYRDYVIRALNEDKPYDRFVMEQLAGDALGADEATGFLVAGPWDQVKSPDEVLTRNQRADELHDIINTTGAAFLGLTLGCARCHEHKFDPVPQRDYYAIKAVFEGVQHGERPLRSVATETRRRDADRERATLAGLDAALSAYVLPAFGGRTVVLDEEPVPGADPEGPQVRELVPHTARGDYPAGTARGEFDDPGDAGQPPTLTRSYLAWNGVRGRDVFAWQPRVTGRFRLWLSWGSGWNTHARDATYVLDADGDPATTGDQRVVARVDQQRFADATGAVPNRPLWSGLFDAGTHDFTATTCLLLRGGESDAYVAADVVVLQEIGAGAPPAVASAAPRLRPAVNAVRNEERFAPVETRRLRFTIEASSGAEPCLDELEVFSAGESPTNVALATAGTKATASGTYPNNEFHQLAHLNDGRYGNARSWISNQPGRGWVTLEFPGRVTIDRVVWGRDREGAFADRVATTYRIEVEAGEGKWRTVAGSEDRAPFIAGRKAGAALGFAAVDDASRQRLTQLLADRARHAAVLKELTAEPAVYAGRFAEPEPTRRFQRGDPMQPREEVAPGGLTFLAARLPIGLAGTNVMEPQRRLAFARWVADPANPLTPRVMVNRLWQYHFGEGLVSTPSDFGANGARPSHPALLDWLAADFVGHQWSLKHVHRLIVTSATYRQESQPEPAALAVDAGARLLWRFPPRRLEAEAIRDSILAVSGNLDPRMGGPGWSPFEPNDNYVRVYTPRQHFGPDECRRMVYAVNVRQRPDGVFGAFDCPDGGQIAPKRTRSTTPLQALNLLNSPFLLDQAAVLAERLEREAGAAPAAQVRRAFALLFNRAPDPDELRRGVAFIDHTGLKWFCRALFNANEFLYLF